MGMGQVPETAVLLRYAAVRRRSRKCAFAIERDCIQQLSAMQICPGEINVSIGCRLW